MALHENFKSASLPMHGTDDAASRAFLVDFDGTLLNSRREASSGTRKALAELVETGWMYVPASSRPPAGLRFEELPSPRYLIALNGALVVDEVAGVAHVRASMDPEVTRGILDCMGVGAICNVYTPHHWFSSDVSNFRVTEEQRRLRTEALPLPALGEHLVCKCLALGEADELDSIETKLQQKFRSGVVSWFRSEPEYLEIGPATASKGAALSFVRDLISDPSFVVAVGDGPADAELLSRADFGLAVSNAVPEVKRVAAIVAPSNDEEGVAEIAKWLLEVLP